jgi:photosystem II stability/assembly factor-like uncharacterized protein
MKKSLFVFLLLITHYSLFIDNCFSQSGWYQVTNPINNLYLNRIQFTSENTGYAIGPIGNSFQGYLLKTVNGGTNWQSIPLDSMWYWSLYFVDNNTGFTVGEDIITHHGIIKKTTNGGINWITCLVGLSNDYFSIYFVDYNTGYAGGKYNDVVKTTNGGIDWVSKPGAVGTIFNDVYFFNANTGFALGSRINKTTNGGDNWYLCDSINDNFYSIFFMNNTTGYTVNWDGNVFKTTNSGDSWLIISSIAQGLNSIFFTNLNTGYTCPGGYNVHKTTNGGLNWFEQNTDPLNYYNYVFFLNENTGFIIGEDGIIMKTTNGGNVFVHNNTNEIPDKYSLYQNYPNPFNPTTKIKFDIPTENKFPLSKGGLKGVVSLKIYDITGREIQTLVNEKLIPGTYEITFDGSNYASGVYFYQLKSGDFVNTKKLILLK